MEKITSFSSERVSVRAAPAQQTDSGKVQVLLNHRAEAQDSRSHAIKLRKLLAPHSDRVTKCKEQELKNAWVHLFNIRNWMVSFVIYDRN